MIECGACVQQRIHTPEEWKNHPHAGHGFTREQGWTHPDLPGAVEKTKSEQAANQNEAKTRRTNCDR